MWGPTLACAVPSAQTVSLARSTTNEPPRRLFLDCPNLIAATKNSKANWSTPQALWAHLFNQRAISQEGIGLDLTPHFLCCRTALKMLSEGHAHGTTIRRKHSPASHLRGICQHTEMILKIKAENSFDRVNLYRLCVAR